MKKFFGIKKQNGGHHSPAPPAAGSPTPAQQPTPPSNGYPSSGQSYPQVPPPTSSAAQSQPGQTAMQFPSLSGHPPVHGNAHNGQGPAQVGYGYPPMSSAPPSYGAGAHQHSQHHQHQHQQHQQHHIPTSSPYPPPLHQQPYNPSPYPPAPVVSQPSNGNPVNHLANPPKPVSPVPGSGYVSTPAPPTPLQTTANGRQLTGDPKEDYPIVMAIDFGTTFTGCAFAYRRDPEIQEITSWPKQAYQYPKVPTISLYKLGSPDFLDWGYPARSVMMTPNAKRHFLLSKFKLQLDDQEQHKDPLPQGIQPIDAISDYLQKFHAHVLKEALKNFASTFDQSHIQYCLTVPAMWSDRAKHVMRLAAVRAGMINEEDPAHRLVIVSEPEAAAMYCQHKGEQFNLQKHDRFLICDAGGGTVDLIVFEVMDVDPESGIRKLREVTRGHGASCGSAFLDANMEKLLREKFQKYPLTPMGWGQIMDTFVNSTKPIFPGSDPEMYLQVPNIPSLPDATDHDIGLEDGMLKLTNKELSERVFDPVVKDVLLLIKQQLDQTHCQAIFMVGGFGSSRYLFDRVTQEFATPGRQVRVPPRAELAVVRGAVIYGIHQGSIVSRVTRRWYGVDSAMDFEEGRDPESKKTQSRDGTVRCKDRFSVYIKPGQEVALGECVTKKYMTWCYPRPLDCPLFVSDSPTEPRYVDEPSVNKLGDFQIPMPEIPGMMPGAEVLVEVKMHFGETEIRAEALVLGQTVTAVVNWVG